MKQMRLVSLGLDKEFSKGRVEWPIKALARAVVVRLETTFDFSDPQKFDICAWGGEVLRPRVTHDYIRLKIEAPAAF